jgi:hypothetical protein
MLRDARRRAGLWKQHGRRAPQHEGGGKAVRYTVANAWLGRIIDWNTTLDPLGRPVRGRTGILNLRRRRGSRRGKGKSRSDSHIAAGTCHRPPTIMDR